MCIAHPGPLRNEVTDSPDFWSILQKLHLHEEAAPLVFDLLKLTIESNPPIVTAHNYEFVVGLADNFISAGSVGSFDERQKDSQAKRSKGAKPTKVMYEIINPSFIFVIFRHFSGLKYTDELESVKIKLLLVA